MLRGLEMVSVKKTGGGADRGSRVEEADILAGSDKDEEDHD